MSNDHQFIIRLENLRFTAHHGLYPEEALAGNEFRVDLWLAFVPAKEPFSRLEDTVNYERVYEVVKAHMDRRTNLLETLAMHITEEIGRDFPVVQEMEITIRKAHPPIRQFTGQVAVTYRKRFTNPS
ncbi:MAG TPA: dihydroneopterin aldolase [Chitinophagaceae bacterium]|nr:dihydroneopterin aldolase [Chitinophagaceae bacterium]